MMRSIKRIAVTVLVLALLFVSVNAEDTYTLYFDASLDLKTGETTYTPTEIDEENDYSDLWVEVTKIAPDGTVTPYYTGLLGDYDDGRWVHMDLTKPLMLCDWQTKNSYWVFPIDKAEIEQMQVNMLDEVVVPSIEIELSFCINDMEINEAFETQILETGDNLCVQYAITNTENTAQSVLLALGIYDLQGCFLDVAVISDVVGVGETKNIEKDLTINSNECYIKAMLWDGVNSLRPLHDAVKIGGKLVNVSVVTAMVDCVLNKEINLVTTAENMPPNDDGQYTITYNPSKLELIDLCSLTYKKELTAGAINGTSITIVSVDTSKGEIVFKNPNADMENVSKVLNSVKFKGLVSGEQTAVTVK